MTTTMRRGHFVISAYKGSPNPSASAFCKVQCSGQPPQPLGAGTVRTCPACARGSVLDRGGPNHAQRASFPNARALWAQVIGSAKGYGQSQTHQDAGCQANPRGLENPRGQAAFENFEISVWRGQLGLWQSTRASKESGPEAVIRRQVGNRPAPRSALRAGAAPAVAD